MTQIQIPTDAELADAPPQPRVSVVVPLYNHERFIAQAIDSVLAQSVGAEQIIVVDDGSSDGSAARMGELCAAHPQIVFWSRPNQGAHHALNAAVLRATGDFVAILNSDDCYHPDRLRACLAAVRADPAVDLVATGVRFTDADGRPLHNDWYEQAVRFFGRHGDLSLSLFHANFLVSTSNFFVRRSVFDRVGYFAPLRYAHDLEFVLRLLLAGCRIRILSEPLLDYRVHGRNTIGQDVARQDAERAAIYAFFLHRRWSRGEIDAAGLQRHVEQLGRQGMLDAVEYFLGLLARGPADRGAAANRLAEAFLEFQQRLGIDLLARDAAADLLACFAAARDELPGRGQPWATVQREQREALTRALDQAAKDRDWLAGQRDAWEKVARVNLAQVASLGKALEEAARSRQWLAGQRDAWQKAVTAQQEWVQEAERARDWFAGQRDAWQKAVTAQQEWVREAERAREWLAGQRDAWQKLVAERDAHIASLGRAVEEAAQARDWFAGQRDAWEKQAREAAELVATQDDELARLRRALAESQAEADRLRRDIEGLLGRWPFRLLQRARLLKPEHTAPPHADRHR